MRAAALKPLRQYEPWRDGYSHPGAQLALDVPTVRIPAARSASDTEPLSAWYVRTVFTAVLDARTGVRPLSRVQAMVHPRLYRHLGLYRPLRDVRFTLRSVRRCRVAPDAYETCGTAHTAHRAYALVGRFELLDQGWRLVLFDIVRPALRRA